MQYGEGEQMAARILIVVNVPEFFVSHRLPIALAALGLGYDVHVATGDGEAIQEIKSNGLKHHLLPLSRNGTNLFQEARAAWSIFQLFRQLKPDLVHLVTIKPVLYGGLAARLTKVGAVVVAISGLGSVFVDEQGRNRAVRKAVEYLYRSALGNKNQKVILQNPDDFRILVDLKAIKARQSIIIRGSGVSLDEYAMVPEEQGTPVATFAARLLRDKGVLEFIESARILRRRGVGVRFWLIGTPDSGNSSSVTEDELDAWRKEKIVEVFGYRSDIPRVLASSHVIVLPSYYREGLPKVLVEAAACGRAVVTTDLPGCRDAIEPERTGFLVPARDPESLADAIQRLVENPSMRKRMGKAGRVLAEREFGVDGVVQAHLSAYRELLS